MRINIPNTIRAFISRIFLKKIDYKSIVFSSSYNTSFDYNARYLFEFFLKNAPEFKCYYVVNDDDKRVQLSNLYGEEHFINTRTYQGSLVAQTCGIWVTSAGLPVYIPYAGKKRRIINVWHGMPLKKIGTSHNTISLKERIKQKFFFSDNYHSISVSSDFFVPFFSEAFTIDKSKIKVFGEPREDTVYNNINKNAFYKRWGLKKVSEKSKIVLYAPTFRDYSSTKFFPFEDYDNDDLNNWLVKNDIVILIRPHKSEVEAVGKHLNTNIVLLDNDIQEDIMECLNLFEMLITDYSSILFNYLPLDKPVIFLPYDLDSYIGDRGFFFNYNDYASGPRPTTQSGLIEEIHLLFSNSEYYKKNRKEAKEKFCFKGKNSCEVHYDYIKELSGREITT